MDVTIQQLRTLRELHRAGTITDAATRLGYTPSAVSQQLSTLERSTGVSVLERVGRNVILTDTGCLLVKHAEIVLEQLERAQADIEQARDHVAGELHLGFVESVASTLLEPIMRELTTRYPDLTLRTAATDGNPADASVRSGDLHASFAVSYPGADDQTPKGLDRHRVLNDWFRLVVPTDWFGEPPPARIGLGALDEIDIIGPPANDICGKTIRSFFAEAEVNPTIAHRTADYPTTLRLVAAGVGPALVPDLGLVHLPAGVQRIDLQPPQHRSLDLVVRSASRDRPAIRALIDVVWDVATDMGLDTLPRPASVTPTSMRSA